MTGGSGGREAYRISDDPTDVALEARRHEILASVYDGSSQRLLERLGLAAGWRCLDVGAGGGSLARWLAARVGPTGRVLATDIDVRFQPGSSANLDVRRHDVQRDPLPADHFDLVHARGVLQHLERREQALDRMVAAARPGGLLVVQDVDWIEFDAQEIPEPFASLSRLMRRHAEAQHGYDGTWGRRMLPALKARGLREVEAEGRVFTMHGGRDSAEWYVLALERAAPRLVEAGLFEESFVREALTVARDPDFAILSPVLMTAWGRRPAGGGA